MKPPLLISQSNPLYLPIHPISAPSSHPPNSSISPSLRRSSRPFNVLFASANSYNISVSETTTLRKPFVAEQLNKEDEVESEYATEVGTASQPLRLTSTRMSLNDKAFWLLSFIACTTSVAFSSLVVAAVPTLFAMSRAATSLAKLADTAREELPSTMAALRLSSMEISDLTLELSELSQEITDGVVKSSQAVQAAKAGIGQMGSIAHQKTMSMIEERANLPPISLRPVVAGAAKKTTQAVGRATKSLLNMIHRGEHTSDDIDD